MGLGSNHTSHHHPSSFMFIEGINLLIFANKLLHTMWTLSYFFRELYFCTTNLTVDDGDDHMMLRAEMFGKKCNILRLLILWFCFSLFNNFIGQDIYIFNFVYDLSLLFLFVWIANSSVLTAKMKRKIRNFSWHISDIWIHFFS